MRYCTSPFGYSSDDCSTTGVSLGVARTSIEGLGSVKVEQLVDDEAADDTSGDDDKGVVAARASDNVADFSCGDVAVVGSAAGRDAPSNSIARERTLSVRASAPASTIVMPSSAVIELTRKRCNSDISPICPRRRQGQDPVSTTRVSSVYGLYSVLITSLGAACACMGR